MKIIVGTNPSNVQLFDDAGTKLDLPIVGFTVEHHGLNLPGYPLRAWLEVELWNGTEVQIPDQFVTVEKVRLPAPGESKID